jgi:predicted enzyme related to lactoylglutathione lyase
MSGQLIHFEFPARDPERARRFYGTLFGWRFEAADGPDAYYTVDGDPGGALYGAENGETGPILYFDVDDIDSAIDQVRRLGGRAEEKHAVAGVGCFAHCRDTEGNPFSLFQAEPADEAELEWTERLVAAYAD